MQIPSIKILKDQIVKSILYLRQAPDFIMDNKLWQGYLSIGWISKLCVLVAIVFSYAFISGVFEMFNSSENAEIVQQGSFSFYKKLENLGNAMLLSGLTKYFILILLETIIFHFAVKTQNILSGENRELTIKDFVAAEIRMIKVALRSWVFEIILSAVAVFALKLAGLDILSTVVFFLIQSYFLGLAFIDNYNEQHEISIKESFSVAYEQIGASLLVGIVAYTLFLIPLFGIILTPFICAVGTTTYMHCATKNVNAQTVLS